MCPRREVSVPAHTALCAHEAGRVGAPRNGQAVALLGLVVSDPPTQSEVQAIVSKLDELITALRR
jgi:hypothetical protein